MLKRFLENHPNSKIIVIIAGNGKWDIFIIILNNRLNH